MKKIFVTGGAGFIGSNIVRELLTQDYRVTAYDNLHTGASDNLPEGAELITGDIRDEQKLSESIAGHDAVIHLAALAIVPDSVKDPEGTFAVNLDGGKNLLAVMKQHQIKKLVYTSSAAVYGAPDKQPIAEDDPKHPINPYGESKLEFEKECARANLDWDLDVTTFRYFNPFGPGENHDPETHAVPNFIQATLDKKPVPLYWNGDQIRDFFYVGDLAFAHVKALDLKGFQTYNLGSGTGIKVRDLLEKIFEIVGHRTEIEDLGERPGDPPVLLADVSKAKHEIGWSPTPIDEALKLTIDSLAK